MRRYLGVQEESSRRCSREQGDWSSDPIGTPSFPLFCVTTLSKFSRQNCCSPILLESSSIANLERSSIKNRISEACLVQSASLTEVCLFTKVLLFSNHPSSSGPLSIIIFCVSLPDELICQLSYSVAQFSQFMPDLS